MYRLGGSAEDKVPRDVGCGGGWGGGRACRVSGISLASLPQSIYKLKKACSVEMEAEQQGKLLTPEEIVDRIFLLVDKNGDGNWSRDDGGAGAGGSPSWVTPLSPRHLRLGPSLPGSEMGVEKRS